MPVSSGVGDVGAVGGWRWCCVATVGGAGDGVGEGAAGGAVGDVKGEGAVGDALVDGGVLTLGVGPRHSWLRFPWASLAGVLAPLASLMSMVLYRVVSLWRLSLTLRVVVAEVAVSMAVSVMPVVRSLLWFTASLMLLMLLLVGVGLCVGGHWLVFGGGRWLVSVALSGRVCSRWCGLLVMLLVGVVQVMPWVVSWVRVVLVAPVVWVLLVTAWRMARVLLLMVLGVCPRLPWPGLGCLLVHRLWWLLNWFPLAAEVARCDADGGVMLAMVCLMPLALVM